MLLNGLFNRLDTFFKTGERANNGKPVHPLFMILMYCEKCLAGQMAFWLYLIQWHELYPHYFFIILLRHLLFVAYTILCTLALGIIYKQTQK